MSIPSFIVRTFVYLWTLPTTAVGLLFLLAMPLSHGRIKARVVDGVLELHGGAVSFFLRRCTLLRGGAAAMTLGHVVLGIDQDNLVRTRRHERVHVRQAERWGPFFIPAYGIASIIAWRRGLDPYLDNAFEREAFRTTR